MPSWSERKRLFSLKMLDGTGIKTLLICHVSQNWHEEALFAEITRLCWYKQAPLTQKRLARKIFFTENDTGGWYKKALQLNILGRTRMKKLSSVKILGKIGAKKLLYYSMLDSADEGNIFSHKILAKFSIKNLH